MTTSFNPTSTDLIDDFDTFLRYLEKKPNLPLTAAGDLKSADLWAINERVNYKAPDYVTARSQQADCPLLNSLYKVIMTSRLTVVQSEKAGTLMLNLARLDA